MSPKPIHSQTPKPDSERNKPHQVSSNESSLPSVGLPAQAILRLQRTVGNRAAQRMIESSFIQRQLSPSPKLIESKQTVPVEETSAIQQTAQDTSIQRAVGFEFQTNWGVIEKTETKGAFGRTKTKRTPFNKGETLHHYPGFKLTADEAGTALGSEIEWVVDPPIPESTPANQVDQLMQRLENLVAQMMAMVGQQSFMLDQVTNDPRDATVEVQPQIKGAANAANMKSNPQVTGGIRLDQMQTLFKQLADPNQADPQHRHVLGLLTGMGDGGIFNASGAAADRINGSDKLKGLGAQLIAYLKAGADPMLALGMNPSAGRAFDYAKLIGKLMARTDFGSQFMLLDQNERQPFEANPQTFVDLILNAAGMGGTDDVHVFQRGVKNEAGNAAKGMFQFPVTRRDWLAGITRGTDQLSSKAMPQWKDELEGLGALGNKTDTVGNNERGVVAEFRTVQQQIPYMQWRAFANEVFAYLVQLNASQSPQQETASLFNELPQDF